MASLILNDIKYYLCSNCHAYKYKGWECTLCDATYCSYCCGFWFGKERRFDTELNICWNCITEDYI